MSGTKINQIVHNLNSIFIDFVNYDTLIKRKYSLSDTDIRFTYFRTSGHIIDSAIHLLMMCDKNIRDRKYLEDIYNDYSIKNRFLVYPEIEKSTHEILYNITGQFIANGYSSSMYHLFENAFRIICQQYDLKKHDNQKGKFNNIFQTFIKEFENDTKLLDGVNTELYEYIQIVRNSLHNNGAYVDKDKTDRPDVLNFDKDRITFKHNQPIATENGVWYELVKMSSWYMRVIGGIISVPKIESKTFIPDPSHQ